MTRGKKGAWAFGCIVGLEALLASGLGIQSLRADGPKSEQTPVQRKRLEERARAIYQKERIAFPKAIMPKRRA
jgi:hypothetical protein